MFDYRLIIKEQGKDAEIHKFQADDMDAARLAANAFNHGGQWTKINDRMLVSQVDMRDGSNINVTLMEDKPETADIVHSVADWSN